MACAGGRAESCAACAARAAATRQIGWIAGGVQRFCCCVAADTAATARRAAPARAMASAAPGRSGTLPWAGGRRACGVHRSGQWLLVPRTGRGWRGLNRTPVEFAQQSAPAGRIFAPRVKLQAWRQHASEGTFAFRRHWCSVSESTDSACGIAAVFAEQSQPRLWCGDMDGKKLSLLPCAQQLRGPGIRRREQRQLLPSQPTS